MNSAEMFVFVPMFALALVVTVGWTVTEVQRLRSRTWQTPARFGTPLQLAQPTAPKRQAEHASNDERQRLAA